jgi:hypothetical protein
MKGELNYWIFLPMMLIPNIISRSIHPIGKLEYPVCMPQAPSAATDEIVSAKFSGVVSFVHIMQSSSYD